MQKSSENNARKRPKNKGVHVSFWVTDEQAQKLDALAEASGQTRTKILKALIDNAPIIDRSYWRTYSQLASIGGLIKGKLDSGEHSDAYRLGQQILKIARELERLEKERQLCARQS